MFKELKTYLKNIENISTKDKEHTHRSALEKLLNDIKIILNKKTVKIKQEPNNDE